MMFQLQEQQVEVIRNKQKSNLPFDQEPVECYLEMEQTKAEVLDNLRSPGYKSPLKQVGKFDFTKDLCLIQTNQKYDFGQTFELNIMDEMVESCDQYLNLVTSKKQKSPSPTKMLQSNMYNFNIKIQAFPKPTGNNIQMNPYTHFIPMKFINPTPVFILKNGLVINETKLTQAIEKNYDSELSFSDLLNQQYIIRSCKQTNFRKEGVRYLSIQLEAIQGTSPQSLQYLIKRFKSFTNKDYKFIADNLEELEKVFNFSKKTMFSSKSKKGTKSSQEKGLQELKSKKKLQQSDMLIYQYSLDSPDSFKKLEYVHINEVLLRGCGYTIQECQKQIGQEKILPDLCFLKFSPQYLDLVKKSLSSKFKNEKPNYSFECKSGKIEDAGNKVVSHMQGMNSYDCLKIYI